MIPFDPASIWLWGSAAESPETANKQKVWVGEVQQMTLTTSMDTSMGVS